VVEEAQHRSERAKPNHNVSLQPTNVPWLIALNLSKYVDKLFIEVTFLKSRNKI
jgi:hypothetical protein